MRRALLFVSLASLVPIALACSSSTSTNTPGGTNSGSSSGGSGSSSGGTSSGGSGSGSGGTSSGGSGSGSGSSSGGSSGGDAGSNPFVGTWQCSNQTHLTFTQPPGAPPQNGTTQSTVGITANADGSITAETVSDGGSGCPLKYTTSNDTATLENGQACTVGTVDLTYTSGTVTVTGSSMTSTIQYDFQGTATLDGGTTINVKGTGTSNYTCTKQ